MRHVLKELRGRYGQTTVMALQEVPKWNIRCEHGLSVRTTGESDVAIVLPRALVTSIRWERFEKKWGLVIVDGMIFVSGHILDYDTTSGAESETLNEITTAVGTAIQKVKQAGRVPTIFLGIDANVTPLPNVPGTAGALVARPCPRRALVARS